MKLTYFYIDDVIWTFRDIARDKPRSLFDNPFMKMLKKSHDEYGMTVQLNLFYRTDFYYGNDEFSLSEMPDTYKGEFEAAADWLKLAFHSKQEFPDYPYVNASYDDVKETYLEITNEILRFAGEASLSYIVCPHWLPVSREGCHALADLGVKIVIPTRGDRWEYTGDTDALPYGHAARLLQSRKPETMLFKRDTRDTKIAASICAYNHISNEDHKMTYGRNASVLDEETGLRFRSLCSGLCLNLCSLEFIKEHIEKLNGDEFIGFATHEQYFYPDYFAYQPDYAEKIYLASRLLSENGYRFVNWDEIK